MLSDGRITTTYTHTLRLRWVIWVLHRTSLLLKSFVAQPWWTHLKIFCSPKNKLNFPIFATNASTFGEKYTAIACRLHLVNILPWCCCFSPLPPKRRYSHERIFCIYIYFNFFVFIIFAVCLCGLVAHLSFRRGHGKSQPQLSITLFEIVFVCVCVLHNEVVCCE